MYRSDSYKCTLQRLKYLCSRDRPALFPFDDFNCHEKSFKTYQPKIINYRLKKFLLIMTMVFKDSAA